MKKAAQIVFTIIAKNYYHQAHLLALSYKKFHPEDRFIILFIDDQKPGKNHPDYEMVNISELNITILETLRFQYDILELSTCVKPFFIEWAFRTYPSLEHIIYFDPDILLYKPINLIKEKLQSYDCVLIPHITSTYTDKFNPTEQDIIQSGIYNLGFVALKHNKETERFVAWWRERLTYACFADPENNMFTDQKWMDIAPAFLQTYIVHEKGYDVAYWNLHEYVGKVPVEEIVFFHFSGFNGEKKNISKYQNRYTYETAGEYKKFYEEYNHLLNSVSHLRDSEYKYAWDYFSNGVRIGKAIRRIFFYLYTNNIKVFPHPFSVNVKNSFYHYLLEPVTSVEPLPMNNLSVYFYQTQKAVREQFPNVSFFNFSEQVYKYFQWFINFAHIEHQIPLEFIPKNKAPLHSLFGLPMEDMEIVSLLQYICKEYHGEQFINHAYRIILKRSADPQGLEFNLHSLLSGKANKELILYRLLKSPEALLKLSPKPLTRIYTYYLFFKAALHKALLKLHIIHVKSVVKPAHLPTQKNGVSIIGYMDTENGVGESARGMVRAFEESNINFDVVNIPQPYLRRENYTYNHLLQHKPEHTIKLICANADQLPGIFRTVIPRASLYKSYPIGYWYWESDQLPLAYREAFGYLKEIWVATSYISQNIARNAPIPVVVIPPAFTPPRKVKKINWSQYNLAFKKDDFIFLNLFDSASFWQRKNPFGLIEAFKPIAIKYPQAHLVIKTTNIKKSGIYPQLHKLISQTPQVHLIDGYLSEEEINSCIYSTHAYVSLHKSEGLGIPLVQAMLAGKPVIATAFSGNMDFMTINNAYLVSYQIENLHEPIGPYERGTTWASPSLEHASEQMERVITNKNEREKIAKQGMQDALDYFNPKRISSLIEQRLEIIKTQ